jgi:hypothetical protein
MYFFRYGILADAQLPSIRYPERGHRVRGEVFVFNNFLYIIFCKHAGTGAGKKNHTYLNESSSFYCPCPAFTNLWRLDNEIINI